MIDPRAEVVYEGLSQTAKNILYLCVYAFFVGLGIAIGYFIWG